MSESEVPGGLPPEAFTSLTSPPFHGNKRLWLGLGALAVIVLLIVVTGGFIYLLRDSADPSGVEDGAIPTPTPITAAELPFERQRQDVLVVQVQRTAGAVFGVSILDARRARDIPTIHSQEPPVSAVHSLVQLVSGSGTVINEFRFALPTQVTLEGANIPGVLFDVPPMPFDMIIPVPAGSEPAVVRIVTPSGQVMVEREINYRQLLIEPTASNSSPRVLSHWFGWAREALAQIVQPEIKIVVINHQGASVFAVQQAVQDMVTNISPWTLFAPIIRVESIVLDNPTDLGCSTILVDVIRYPICLNSGAVIGAVQQQVADWDLIAVAVDENCDCGTAVPNSKIIAVGNFASAYLVAHEFAHATPTFLADEYLGDLGMSGPTGPNCFASKAACETALGGVGVGEDQCQLGCNTPFTWRPASQLMYNAFVDFGPVEHQLMCEHIADLVGLNCDDAYRLGSSEGMDITDPSRGGGDPIGDPGGGDDDGVPDFSPPPDPNATDDPAAPDPGPGGGTPTPTPIFPSNPTPTPNPAAADPPAPPTNDPNEGNPTSGNNSGFFGGSR